MKKANLITPKGYRLLREEEDQLWRVERPVITDKVTWAASLGDRSENADYKENKAKLRRIHSRVRYLRKRLEAVKIVSYSPEQDGKVFFGAWVTLSTEDDSRLNVQVVGSDEIYQHPAPCSIDSPLARAMIGKQVDDEVLVNTPNGPKTYFIDAIRYDQAL